MKIKSILCAALLGGSILTTVAVSACTKSEVICPDTLKVNLLDAPMGVPKEELSFSWVMNDGNENAMQAAYRIVIAQGAECMSEGAYLFDTDWVESSRSSSVTLDGLSAVLKDNSLYYWSVATRTENGTQSEWSEPQAFFTSVEGEWQSKEGIWASKNGVKASDDFVFLRNEFSINRNFGQIDRVVLSATARSPEPARQYVYNMYVNGKSVGVGPSRYGLDPKGAPLLYYNTYDVTDMIVQGDNALGVICYTSQEKSFLCQLTVFYRDGSSEIIVNSGRDAQLWSSLPGDKIFRKSNSIGTEYYTAHANNIDATVYPFGFDCAGFEDSGWTGSCKTTVIDADRKLVPQQTDCVNRYYSESDPITVSEYDDSTVIDLGYEIVGGFHLEVDSPFECEIELRYGEQLEEDGSVKYQMLTGNVYSEKWNLKRGHQIIDSIDMMTYRYVELIDIPVTITAANARGIEVRTAWDTDEYSFRSDNSLLNDIYELTRHTAKVTTQDLFVDSQSRERRAYEGDCVINMPLLYAFQDNYSVARFSAEYLYMNRTWPADYVLYCSKMALADYMATGDDSSLKKYYEVLKTKNFSRNFNSSVRLLTNGGVTQSSVTDCILVDWPETERDGYDMSVTYNTVLNALSVSAYEELAKIATITDHPDDAKIFSGLADEIRLSMIEKLYDDRTGGFSDGYYSVGKSSSHFSQHATAYALACGIYSDSEMADKMADFLRRSEKIKMSVYGTYFLFDGLYACGHGDIANMFLLDPDTDEGARTWAYMLQVLQATVTTEAWSPVCKDNMTFSHPWGGSPAYAITQGIFGIRPTSPAYETFEVKFQTEYLSNASLTVPTIRGKISASFEKNGDSFVACVTVPANTRATVWLPAVGNKEVLVNGDRTEGTDRNGFVGVVLGSGSWQLRLA